ncbi:flavodoxin family protein [Thermococcus argininiproducens]|uniref:Flavodoxin family protein n=1 Tax=Thermococcus argininiproducens TaxID=2866384 RepID=A0A9E7SCW3_9EURY|nr:flavodoxin family protein [Thermococcus argininiproducens]USG99532.1 flavodoxin family protein [Thermococcus argininiproducens]
MRDKMKALSIAFSARKNGNCARLLGHCLDNLKKRGFDTELLEAYDFRVTPCNHCSYECFSGKCPIEDDVPLLYEKAMKADVLIFAVPTYGGHASGLYRAFCERGQAVFKSYEEWNNFARKLNFIVVGNLSSGGDMALHEVLYGTTASEYWPEILLISSNEYGRSSIRRDLIEEHEIRKRINRFVERIIQKVSERSV